MLYLLLLLGGRLAGLQGPFREEPLLQRRVRYDGDAQLPAPRQGAISLRAAVQDAVLHLLHPGLLKIVI